VGRGERPIKLGDSSYSPKCILVQRRRECDGGRATNRARGRHCLPTPDELRMPSHCTGSEAMGAKVHSREGKNPDQQLRSLNNI
jgi:hypothetical protein